MIQVNELRIGNWVMPTKSNFFDTAFKPCQVQSIISKGINAWSDMGASGELALADMNPIPLTPEILEKAGFVKEIRRDYGGDTFVVYHFDGVDIHEGNSPDEFNYATYVKGATSSFKAGIGVKWVHHLQNLIHSLTGTELNINL